MSEHTIVAAQPEKARKLLNSYIAGFVLSAILVVIAYATVQHHLLAGISLYSVLVILLLAELFVQAVFVLRLNTSTDDDKWNLFSFLFTILIMAIVVTGSLWIMYNLNYNMMN